MAPHKRTTLRDQSIVCSTSQIWWICNSFRRSFGFRSIAWLEDPAYLRVSPSYHQSLMLIVKWFGIVIGILTKYECHWLIDYLLWKLPLLKFPSPSCAGKKNLSTLWKSSTSASIFAWPPFHPIRSALLSFSVRCLRLLYKHFRFYISHSDDSLDNGHTKSFGNVILLAIFEFCNINHTCLIL